MLFTSHTNKLSYNTIRVMAVTILTIALIALLASSRASAMPSISAST